MEKTVVVGSPNTTGNIGLCEVKSQNISINSFTIQTVATNSCTGQIIGQYTYTDYGSLILTGLLSIIGLAFGVMVGKIIVD